MKKSLKIKNQAPKMNDRDALNDVHFPRKNNSWEHELIQRIAHQQGGTHVFELSGPNTSIGSPGFVGRKELPSSCEVLFFCFFLTLFNYFIFFLTQTKNKIFKILRI